LTFAAVALKRGTLRGVSPRRPRRKGGSLKDGERRQIARAARHGPAAPLPVSGSPRVLCDGGSRGNPGPAAIAAVLLGPDGAEQGRLAETIGRATAAEAEYRAILLGLSLALARGHDEIEVCSDSRLAIAAIEGRTPDDPGLAALVADIEAIAGGFAAVRWHWHPRAANEVADALVRELLWG
jgi:ribonuclease HI